MGWYLLENRRLADELFLRGNQVKSISVFRGTNKGIKIFANTQTEAKKMVQARFGRLEDKFFSLIPKALPLSRFMILRILCIPMFWMRRKSILMR